MRRAAGERVASCPGCWGKEWRSQSSLRPCPFWVPLRWGARWVCSTISSGSCGSGSGWGPWAPFWISSTGLWPWRPSFSTRWRRGMGMCGFICCWERGWAGCSTSFCSADFPCGWGISRRIFCSFCGLYFCGPLERSQGCGKNFGQMEKNSSIIP